MAAEASFLQESEEAIWAAPDLSDLDPTAEGGFKITYAREVPLEMRLQTSDEAPQEVGILEAILCKVAVAGDPASPSAVKVELSSESDLFFHYSHIVDEKSFRAMRDEQRLMIEFPEYANVLAASFNNAIKEPHTFLAVFIMNRDGQARLDFIQNVSFKFVELLSINFNRSADDLIRKQITFRYNATKSKLAVLQARLQEVVNVVKIKNPSLLLQLSKPSAMAGGAQAGAGAGGMMGATAAAMGADRRSTVSGR